MIRKSVAVSGPVFLLPRDQKVCNCFIVFIFIQSVAVFIGATSVLKCYWNLDKMSFEYYNLACLMYLYDRSVCSEGATNDTEITKEFRLNNSIRNTSDIFAIKYEPPTMIVSTGLASKTRVYLKASIGCHIIWCVTAVAVKCILHTKKYTRILAGVLNAIFYVTLLITFFDLSMAIVYLSHINQSLTKNMIIRHSGYNPKLHVTNLDDFGGWLPLSASFLWARCFIGMAINIFYLKMICVLLRKIKRRDISRRFVNDNYNIPEPNQGDMLNDRILYYRPGNMKPLTQSDGFKSEEMELSPKSDYPDS